MARIDPIIIQNFNDGGLSDSRWSGISNSLYKLTGFDPHSTPGILKVAQKMVENSGGVVTEFCKSRVASSNGCTYWGSYQSGKIWQRDAAGVWTLVKTISAGAGQSKILNMVEYQKYIYVFTQSKIHRILASDGIGATDWGSNLATDWATFSSGDLEFHPTVEQNLVLYIGDGKYIAQVDAGVFSSQALDVANPHRIKSLGKLGTRILAGTYISNNITKTEIVDWDTFSDSFNISDTIDEVGINAFLEADNYVYCNCGLAGNLYVYNGEALQLYKKIPGDYSPTAQAVVNPQAVANKEGEILFGVSNVLGNPCDQGLYRIGHHSNSYKYIMDFPYPISERLSTALVITNVEIGAVLVVGANIFQSWKRTATVSITIAAPGVVTYTAHGLTNGDPIEFFTAGTLPTGLTAGTTYFIRTVDTNSFNVYDTAAHAIAGGTTGRITTSGSQSGTPVAYTFGVDMLDYSNKLDGAYFETRVARADRFSLSTFSPFQVAYASLPTSTTINISYKKDYATSYVDLIEKNDETKKLVIADESVEAVTLQTKVAVTVSSNNAPEIEALYVPIK
jgi:hypothetical protein